MRVLVATAEMGELSASEAGTIMARAWAAQGAEVAVIPMAVGGSALRQALAELGCHDQVLDLTVTNPETVTDPVLGVVAEDEQHLPLTGLQGVAARRGRREGWDIARVLDEDARLAEWSRQLWPDQPDASLIPGSGAHGGAGLKVLAAGGSLISGPALCSQLASLPQTASQADLIVTGCDRLDFGCFGGPVIAHLIRQASSVSRPLVVLAGCNYISSRELRQAGIEAAHAISDTGDITITASALAALAQRVAAVWMW